MFNWDLIDPSIIHRDCQCVVYAVCVTSVFRFRSFISLLRNTFYAFCFLLHFIYIFPMYYMCMPYPVPRLIDAASFRHNDDSINCTIVCKFTKLWTTKACAILYPSREFLCSNLYFILYSLHLIRRTESMGATVTLRLRKTLRNHFWTSLEIGLCVNDVSRYTTIREYLVMTWSLSRVVSVGNPSRSRFSTSRLYSLYFLSSRTFRWPSDNASGLLN